MNKKTEKYYKIKEVSELTGLTRHTLRYYEKIGLIEGIARESDTHRYYSDTDIEWIEFLNRLRVTGMPIKQMLEFADLRRLGNSTAFERRQLLEKFKDELDKRIVELNKHRKVIDEKIKHYKRLEKQTKQRREK